MSIDSRKLKSGKTVYDVRLRTPDGHPYKRTFRTKRDAETFEARELADRSRSTWIDPRAADVTLAAFTERWLANRSQLRPTTRELYERLLRLHILPTFGDLRLAQLNSSAIRQWHGELSGSRYPGASTVAKAYRLLRTVLNTAVEDNVIGKNPCLIEGAGVERAPERPTATIPEVFKLADAIERRYRLMVVLAAFGGLRLGELLGLRRADVDVRNGVVRIHAQALELKNGTRFEGPPKSGAGVRTVALPPQIAPELIAHLEQWTADESEALLFTEEDGSPLTRRIWNLRWQAARTKAGVGQLHFHDLRHTANTLAAATGASTKELMARMGHSTARAALIYQHATRDRDVVIAKAIGELVEAAKVKPGPTATVTPIEELRANRESRQQSLFESG
jgi:integrase